MAYKPATFKLRYFPADDCDINELLTELIEAGMLVRYDANGGEYAYIPAFTKHQVINNREAESTLPPPDSSDASVTRESGVSAEGRKEGREGKEGARKRAVALPGSLKLTDSMREHCRTKAPNVDPDEQFERFCDHHRAKGSKFRDWEAAWRTWVGKAADWAPKQQPKSPYANLPDRTGEFS